MLTRPIRLIAIDIDGTLLDSKFQVSQANLHALRRAHEAGIEIVLGTGRRHKFALPIAESLGFDLWLISSNGAVTRSLGGELFHRDLLPQADIDVMLALFRNGDESWSPDTALFLTIVDGRARMLRVIDEDCWRVEVGT